MPKQRDPDKVQMTFWLPRSLRDAAKEKAKQEGTDVSTVVRNYLERWSKR